MAPVSLNDYALIGNRTSSALVSRFGSIDWCCLPFLDSPSHFGALLEPRLGGRFQIVPQGDFRSEQRYLQRTQIVETLFETPHGRGLLVDWMPVEDESGLEPVIHRRLETLSGQISWSLVCSPRFAYGTLGAQAEAHRGGVLFRGPHGELCQLHAQVPLEIAANGAEAHARFALEAGNTTSFEWSWGRRADPARFPSSAASVERWHSWAHRCTEADPPESETAGCVFAGPWHDLVTRTTLLLKLLTAPYSGAVTEAVTTSINEIPGTSRTWDHRYAWLRDSARTLHVLHALGLRAEARAYFGFISDLVIRDGAESLQSVYTLDGGKVLPERAGNRALRLFHLDVHGHVMLAAEEFLNQGGRIPAPLWEKLAEIADYVCQAWRRPDHGPWDWRGKPEHFVVSKIHCWAALDRARSIARRLEKRAPARWEQEETTLRRTICEQGFDETQNTFVEAFGRSEVDSTTLLMPLLGFLPFDDPRVLGTLDAVSSKLSQGVLVYRRQAPVESVLSDAPHLWSSFLFVSCLAHAGRVDEASDRLAELCTYTTPLGLPGEQVEPATGELSGNFPSAAVSIAMIDAALSVGLARAHHRPPYRGRGGVEAA